MPIVEFDAEITDGAILILEAHRRDCTGTVHIILRPQHSAPPASKIDELLENPLRIASFHPLKRDQAHERT